MQVSTALSHYYDGHQSLSHSLSHQDVSDLQNYLARDVEVTHESLESPNSTHTFGAAERKGSTRNLGFRRELIP